MLNAQWTSAKTGIYQTIHRRKKNGNFVRICYFFTISLCLRVTNTIKIIAGAGGMQSPFSASIHGWSCAVLAQKTENPGQTETLLSPWQWLILCVPAQLLKAIRILHNPCYKTVDTHELLYIHLSTRLPSDNSVKIIFCEMRDQSCVLS